MRTVGAAPRRAGWMSCWSRPCLGHPKPRAHVPPAPPAPPVHYSEEEEQAEGPEVPSSEEESEPEADTPLSEDEGGGGGGLIVTFDERRAGVAKSADAAVAQWFSQGIFADADVEDADEDADAVVRQKRKAPHGAAPPARERGGSGDEQPPAAAVQQQLGSEDEEPSSGSDAEGEAGTAAALKRQKAAGGARGGAAAYGLSVDALAGPEDGFEVVPAAESGSGSESEDEFELMDDDAKVGQRGRSSRHGGAAAGNVPPARFSSASRPYPQPHQPLLFLFCPLPAGRGARAGKGDAAAQGQGRHHRGRVQPLRIVRPGRYRGLARDGTGGLHGTVQGACTGRMRGCRAAVSWRASLRCAAALASARLHLTCVCR